MHFAFTSTKPYLASRSSGSPDGFTSSWTSSTSGILSCISKAHTLGTSLFKLTLSSVGRRRLRNKLGLCIIISSFISIWLLLHALASNGRTRTSVVDNVYTFSRPHVHNFFDGRRRPLTRKGYTAMGSWKDDSLGESNGLAGIQLVSGRSSPKVVVITVMEAKFSASPLGEAVRQNRLRYAEKHGKQRQTRPGVKTSGFIKAKLSSQVLLIAQGNIHIERCLGYAVFITTPEGYSIEESKALTWAKIPSIRHAMTLYPSSVYFFYVAANALIMNSSLSVEEQLTKADHLESIMLYDELISPGLPARTWRYYKPVRRKVEEVYSDEAVKRSIEANDKWRSAVNFLDTGKRAGLNIDMIMTKDRNGLARESLLIRGGTWARYLLDVWNDPIYRTYKFRNAEMSALEHILNRHPSILARFALVPQVYMNSYSRTEESRVVNDRGIYRPGQFIVSFGNCTANGRNCGSEMMPFYRAGEVTLA